ncbi:MAG: S26 family signal peptidase [Prevotellaceae bacterium]|nr:S26 family signal peptidase [Prevotellaceae bacterium]
MDKKPKITTRQWVTLGIVLPLYLLFLYWVESWWGLLLVPFIIDFYTTRFIDWYWWRKSSSGVVRTLMGWVDAIVFALVAIYFLNLYFFQNFVIPSSSLEKTLLTGDYLLVSKLSYGPRIPQTPLTMPLTQHNLPMWLGGGKSYVEWPKWDYRRVKGFGQVKPGDIVVFNYPSGDTVANNFQAQDYYQLVYSTGAQALGVNEPSDSLPPAVQRMAYEKIYAVGHNMLWSEPSVGGIITRPVDRRENYVKRCVGGPGQTLQIKNNVIYLDGKAQPQPKDVQFNYLVHFKRLPTPDFCKENEITEEDLQRNEAGTVTMPLTEALRKKLERMPDFCDKPVKAPSFDQWLFPLDMAKKWSTSDYGPLWIPKRGATIKLTLANLPIYERCIAVYEGNRLEVNGGKILINGHAVDSYTFKMDYYWMMGDNRDNSADSRFWGFVPEDHIVGKPLMVWISLDKDYGLFDGKIRWNRFFKWVADIK